MISNDLTVKYSKTTRWIHAISAILIIALFPMGKIMEDMAVSDKMTLIFLHALFGNIVFLLTLVRTYAYFKHERPANIKTGSKLNDRLAHFIHTIFYFLLFAVSISGIVTMISGGYGKALQASDPSMVLPRSEIFTLEGHGIISTVMMILLVMHVVGVVKHYITHKENTLKRIL